MRYSIIIPMYNAEDFIINTLNSIMRNDLSKTEIIIVDDGSTDDGATLAENHLKEAASCQYKIIRQDNGGVSKARNTGISVASGDYIIFCDSDDEMEEGLIEELDETYIDSKAVYDVIAWPFFAEQKGDKKLRCMVSHGPVQDRGIVRSGDYSRNDFLRIHLLEGFKVRLGSFAIKRDIIESGKLRFDESCTLGEDVEFFMKAFLKSVLFHVLEEPYYTYKKHQGSLAYSYNIRRFEAPLAMKRVAECHEAELLPEELREYVGNGLFVLHTIYAFDSCLSYIRDRKALKKFYDEYMEKYGEIESLLRDKMKNMNNPPYGVSFKRLIALRLSTNAYLNYIYLKQAGRKE